MNRHERQVGCGLWLIWLFVALFVAEFLLLWTVLRIIPSEWLPTAVLSIVIATIVGGWAAVYVRVQRRGR